MLDDPVKVSQDANAANLCGVEVEPSFEKHPDWVGYGFWRVS
jgi:hypothetical protein